MRKRFKIPLIGIIALAVIIIAGLILIYKSHFIEKQVNRFLAGRIASQYRLDINIAEIDGSFIDGFILKDVILRFSPDSNEITITHIPRLDVHYDLINLLKGKLIFDSLYFERPQFYLEKSESGDWLLPKVNGKGQSTALTPDWEIKTLVIEDATFNLNYSGNPWKCEKINILASAKSIDNTHSFNLNNLDFYLDHNDLIVNGVSGQATVFKNNIVLDKIQINTDSSRVRLSLVYDGKDDGRLELQLDDSRIFLPDFLALFDINLKGDLIVDGNIYRQEGRIGGNLFLSGEFQNRLLDSLLTRFHYDNGILYLDTLYGKILATCRINGFGELDLDAHPKTYRLSAQIASFDLSQLVANSFQSNLNGFLHGNGRGLKSRNMAIDLNLELGESYFDIYHFHQAKGMMTISTQGLYFFPGFKARYHNNNFFASGNINYNGELYLEGTAALNDLTDFTGQTFIQEPGGRAEGDFIFYGPTVDPNLSGRFRSDSLWLYEFYSSDFLASFDIQSFTRAMRGPVNVFAYNGQGWSFPYDSLFAEMRLDSNLLYIDTGEVDNSFSSISCGGRLNFESYPQELTLEQLDVNLSERNFVAKEDQIILIDSSGFIFEKAVLHTSEGKIDFTGRADYDESIDIDWQIDNIAVKPWASLINDTIEIDGRLSSSGHLGGTYPNPEFELTGAIDSMTYFSLNLGQLNAYLSYQDSLLQIDSMFMVTPQGRYTASGVFPINLDLYFERELFDDREQNIYIYARDVRLDLFSFLLNSVEYIDGNFEASAVITGSPRQPHLNGVSILTNGSIKLIDLRDELKNVQAEIEMQDQLVKINRFIADVPHDNKKATGLVKSLGSIYINDISTFTYDSIRMACDNLPIRYELGDFTGIADADLIISGTTPPRVTGTIVMPAAFYRENFYYEAAGFNLMAALETDKSWDLDIMVEVPSNAWVKNDDIDAEFSGSVNIIRENGIYKYLGVLEVIRGKLYILDRIYTIEPGGSIVYDNIDEPDPKLDLNILTRIRTYAKFSDFESEESYSRELKLHVGGTLNNPIITSVGDSPISTERILPTLFTGIQPAESDTLKGESVGADRITSGLGGILASQFSRLGTRSLGVETFELSPETGKGFDPLATRLTIGAYTLPNLYIFGSSAFDVERGQEVGLEYRLGRHYLFEGRRDEKNLYHFNFKFFWEY